MSAKRETLAGLRRLLAGIDALPAHETGLGDAAPARVTFGMPAMDAALGGGLPFGAVHEIFPAASGDGMAAEAFALAFARRAAGADRTILWVQHDWLAREYGMPHGAGLLEFGIDPRRVILVRARDVLTALRAGHEGLRCAALGTVLIETWGEAKAFDLSATQRLVRSAAASRVSALCIRLGAEPAPSAALARWSVAAAPSQPLPVDVPGLRPPGLPAFIVELSRHRAGFPLRRWHVEWDRDHHVFREPSLSRPVAALPADRPAASAAPETVVPWRRAS
jgi:protein ImuA